MSHKTYRCAAAVLAAAVLFTTPRSAAAQAGSTTPPPPGVNSIPVDMAPIMTLLRNHDKIRFTVQLIPGGVRTTATSTDPAITKLLRLHAAEMRARLEHGVNIRPADPLFVELFRRHTEILPRIWDVPGGVAENETLKDPDVTLLIRAHAEAVSEFVRFGMPRARVLSPLPKGYHSK